MTYLESRTHASLGEQEHPLSPEKIANFISPLKSDARITNISGTFEKQPDPDKGHAVIRRKGVKISGFNNKTEMDETLTLNYDDMIRTSNWALERVDELQQRPTFPEEINKDVMDIQDEIVRLIGVGMILDELIIYKSISIDIT